MEYASEQIKKDWNDLYLHVSERNTMLRRFLKFIDNLSRLTGHGHITLTSYLRNKKGDRKTSCHFWGWAADFRVRDKSVAFYLGMVLLGKALYFLNPRFRMQVHPELFRDNNQHVHCEIRT